MPITSLLPTWSSLAAATPPRLFRALVGEYQIRNTGVPHSDLRSKAVPTATVGDIVRYDDAPTKIWLRLSLALAIASWALLVAAGAPGALNTSGDHRPHALASMLADQDAAAVDHSHIERGSAVEPPDTITVARVPRAATTSAALALIATFGAIGLRGRRLLSVALRAPPWRFAHVVSGRDMLTRFCIARR